MERGVEQAYDFELFLFMPRSLATGTTGKDRFYEHLWCAAPSPPAAGPHRPGPVPGSSSPSCCWTQRAARPGPGRAGPGRVHTLPPSQTGLGRPPTERSTLHFAVGHARRAQMRLATPEATLGALGNEHNPCFARLADALRTATTQRATALSGITRQLQARPPARLPACPPARPRCRVSGARVARMPAPLASCAPAA